MSMATAVYLHGEKGRMGRTLSLLIQKNPNFSLESRLEMANVVIDFSSPTALTTLLRSCIGAKKPLVIGTTGYSANEHQLIQDTSRHIPLLVASNFSIGMALLQEIVVELSQKIPSHGAIEIIEAHHQHKKDRPSGTALQLKDAMGRNSIPIHSIRAGDIVGDHTVIFAFDGERMELKHQAHSREAFALGALRAAEFLQSQPPGLYSMKDLLCLLYK